jgi:hypothetical protein
MRLSGTSQSGRARPGRKYLGALAVALLGVAVLTAACGGGGTAAAGGDAAPTPASQGESSASPTPSSSGGSSQGTAAEELSAIAFAACMRVNGVPDFPDPQPSGGFRITGNLGQNPNFESAREACAHLIPPGRPGGPDAVEPEVLLAFAQCMRENGVPNFPDLTGGGGGMTAGAGGGPGFDPNSPAFQSALEICGPEYGITINIRQ